MYELLIVDYTGRCPSAAQAVVTHNAACVYLEKGFTGPVRFHNDWGCGILRLLKTGPYGALWGDFFLADFGSRNRLTFFLRRGSQEVLLHNATLLELEYYPSALPATTPDPPKTKRRTKTKAGANLIDLPLLDPTKRPTHLPTNTKLH